MKTFVTSKRYAHMSISSLHLLAQRTSALFCSIDTWYKYVRYFEWQRPWKVDSKKIPKLGIRATAPNQLWHIDVTVVNIRPGFKLYIQAVIDNFSRFVLAWRVTDAINAESTIETIRLAKESAVKLSTGPSQTHVMMDPGSENDNELVAGFISSRNMQRVLARVEVHYSNSMIESLFRSLKNNFLYHQGIHTIQDLTRKAAFYFSQHNNVVPQAILGGAIPIEAYQQTWDEEKRQVIKAAKLQAILNRRTENLMPNCGACLIS